MSCGVVAEVTLALTHTVQHHRGILARIGDDLTQRLLHRTRQNLDAVILVIVGARELLDRFQRTHERNTPARNHPFFHGSTCCVQGIFDARFLLLKAAPHALGHDLTMTSLTKRTGHVRLES